MPPFGAYKWSLTFDDEFNAFNWNKGLWGIWQTHYWWGARTLSSNHELEFYSDPTVGVSPFSVKDGVLDITAAPSSGNPLHLPYSSGLITTFPSFRQTYGYFEMRAQLPAGKGLWPAFWLAAADRTWPPELDIMEALGQEPHRYSTNVHSGSPDHDRQLSRTVTVSPDLTAGFHTYGADWEADNITWYFDGRAIASSPTPPDMHKPMYILANLAVAGSESGRSTGAATGPPDATTPFPAHFKIDYIRAYVRAEKVAASPPANGLDASFGPSDLPAATGFVLFFAACCVLVLAMGVTAYRAAHRPAASFRRSCNDGDHGTLHQWLLWNSKRRMAPGGQFVEGWANSENPGAQLDKAAQFR